MTTQPAGPSVNSYCLGARVGDGDSATSSAPYGVQGDTTAHRTGRTYQKGEHGANLNPSSGGAAGGNDKRQGQPNGLGDRWEARWGAPPTAGGEPRTNLDTLLPGMSPLAHGVCALLGGHPAPTLHRQTAQRSSPNPRVHATHSKHLSQFQLSKN